MVPNPPAAGSSTLTYRLDPADGHILANTPMVARWRLIAADDPTDVQLGPEVRTTYLDDRFTWKTQTGGIVTVHWVEGSDAFGKRALKIAQDAIAEGSALLGVTETEPVDFYIYADETSFRDAIGPGLRENVGGLAVAGIRTLFALIPPNQIDDAWVGIVIPHELTHLVFDTASRNPYHFPPHWLNEGLAVYVSQGYDAVGSVDRPGRRGRWLAHPARRADRPVPDHGRSLPAGVRGERVGGRLHRADVSHGRPRRAHPLVCRRTHRR